jgi:hypothetical protein
MDIRELTEDPEETFRTAVAGLLKNTWTAMPTIVRQDSDGHTVTHQPAIQRKVIDPYSGQVTYEDHPQYPDGVVHYPSGGGHSFTHPVSQQDEGVSLFMSRNLDSWRQSGGSQQPIDDRMHSLGDAVFIPGVRSDPRKLYQVATDAAHVRSDDKKHVHEVSGTTGVKSKSVDPSTAPASESFDPFKEATKFYEHLTHPTDGVKGNATDGGTTHSHGVTHDDGAYMRALNALHSVLCHPQAGSSLNAQNLLHSVLAHPLMGAMLSGQGGEHTVTASSAGVKLISSAGITLSAPSVGIPNGALSASAIGGSVGGDLSGSFSEPIVVSLSNVSEADQLPAASTDSAAAAAGVGVGGLYRNTSVYSGCSVICVRMS